MTRAGSVLVAATVILSTLAATPPQDPAVASFAGSVDLHSQGSGSVDVVVEQELRFSFHAIFDGASFDGGGDFPSVSLHDLGTGTAVGVAGAWPSADDSSFYAEDGWLMWPGPVEFGASEPELVLPAGRYRFQVAVDGPATVHLRLADVPTVELETEPGQVSLYAGMATPSTIGPYTAGGSSHTTERPGVTLTAQWQERLASHASHDTTCLYVDVPASQVEYGPGCPSTGSGSSIGFGVGQSGSGSIRLSHGMPAGTYHSGFWRADAGVTTGGGFGTVWAPDLEVG